MDLPLSSFVSHFFLLTVKCVAVAQWFPTGIVHIFCGDWIDCRGISPTCSSFVALFDRLKVKRNSHFTFELIIDIWGARSVENITSVAVISFDAVCMGSPVIIMLTNRYKEKLKILSTIRDHRKKVGKQGRSPTPADVLVDSVGRNALCNNYYFCGNVLW